MSAMSFARSAFNREKPHSSITDWVDILTGSTIAEEAYDGIPELVDSINLQPAAGPAEASRAIRKKLKHGNAHQQYRALVILKALVENCGNKFKTSFADGNLTDVIKHIALNPDNNVDKRVQKKMMLVLMSWHEQFKSDPSMTVVAGLYQQCKREKRHVYELTDAVGLTDNSELKRRAEKEEAKRKAKQEKEEARERARLQEEEREERRRKEKQNKNRPRRAPFDFEKEKPKVLSSIVDASQASSNLVNAITLVNRETDSLQTNERVQECLVKAKQIRKQIVRYVQLVENEDLIGTLIETNDRVIAALEMYDHLSTVDPAAEADPSAIASGLAATHITPPESELTRLQEKQRAAVQRATSRQNVSQRTASGDNAHLHPDLHDLSFGPLGTSSNNLPPPLRPSTLEDDNARRGSLSDFSDYESSDEEAHNAAGASSRARKDYVTVSDDSDDDAAVAIRASNTGSSAVDDPFADPFADEVAVGPSKRW